MRPLTTDLSEEALRPYFLWDEDISVGELHVILADPTHPRRLPLLGKMLREARDTDVWTFVTARQVAAALPSLGRRLGRRARFWDFLIEGWRADGLLP